jgi:hypothetical protein
MQFEQMTCASDCVTQDTVGLVDISSALCRRSLLKCGRTCKLIRVAQHHELLVPRLKHCLINGKAGLQIKRLKIVGHMTSQALVQ